MVSEVAAVDVHAAACLPVAALSSERMLMNVWLLGEHSVTDAGDRAQRPHTTQLAEFVSSTSMQSNFVSQS